jgi:hypothetical protein
MGIIPLTSALVFGAAAGAMWFFRGSKALKNSPFADVAAVSLGALAICLAFYSIYLTFRSEKRDSARLASLLKDQADNAIRSMPKSYFSEELGIEVKLRLETPGASGGASSARTISEHYAALSSTGDSRLMIIGKAGAGKTVSEIQLAAHLLKKWQSGDPVPVQISISSWNTDVPFQEWLAEQLDERRLVPNLRVAREIVEKRMVLPILDGLDEMDSAGVPVKEQRALKALRRLNSEYGDRDTKAPIVLTCRTDRYRQISRKVRLSGATVLELQPLDSSQQLKFLRAAGLTEDDGTWQARWVGVAGALTWSGSPTSLARQLQTPWRMALLTTVYAEVDDEYRPVRDPNHLLAMSAHLVPEHLLGLYVRAATANANAISKSRYVDHGKVEDWLSYVASYMKLHGGNIVWGRVISSDSIILHRMWPLAGNAVRSIDTVLSFLSTLPLMVVATRLEVLPEWSAVLIIAVFISIGNGLHIFGGDSRAWPDPRRFHLRAVVENPLRMLFRCLGAALGAYLVLLVISAYYGQFSLQVWVFLVLSGALMGATLHVSREVVDYAQAAVTNPRHPLRKDFWFGVACAVSAWVVAAGIFSIDLGMAQAVLWSGLLVVVPGFLLSARACRMYMAFRIRTLLFLPSMGRFLDWCCKAGLLRLEGVGYQFRHRELQDHLAV